MGDTTIEGVSTRIIRTRSLGVLFGDPYENVSFQYFTDEPDLIRFYDPSSEPIDHFDTLAWFGAQPGDSWTQGYTTLLTEITVLDTGTRAFDGVPLRYLVVEQAGPTFTEQDTIVERIGSLLHGPIIVYFMQFQEAARPSLICYRDNDLGYVTPFEDMSVCETSLSAMEYNDSCSSMLSLWPNPGAEGVSVRGLLPGPDRTLLAIFDAQGRLVKIIALSSGSVLVPTAELSTGIYTVRITEKQRSTILRWIKA